MKFNEKLSANREKTTLKYVEKNLKDEEIANYGDLTSEYTAQDWEGFQKLVSQSNIQDKDLILSVLSMYKDPEQREKEIRNLSSVFDQLADEILPQLRYSRITASINTIGRSDDETPFVVEWFVRNGVEVWSAVEGQQRFDNHVDKLLNYIRYWQASGESIKTSVRVKTRMEQLTKDGCFTGGIVPFGYKLQKQGRINKKNQEVNDFVIDEDAAEIVRFIFYKYVNEGYGAQRISHYLLENGIRRADGSMIPNTTIVRMIKNK